MSCCESNVNASGPDGKLQAPKRNHYYFSKMMDVLQFDMEQTYHNRQRWLVNRLGIGTGVLCGLGVEVDAGKVCVKSGVALDHVGREVIVPGRYCIDPWDISGECGKPAKNRPRDKVHKVTLCLGYHECLADYAPVMVTDCRSGEACEAGSIVESFKLFVRDGWPDPRPDLCELISDETAGYEIVATIDTGGAPVAVAVAANGKRALALDAATSPRLLVLDLVNNIVSHVLTDQVAAPLADVSVAPDGGPALVTHGKGIVVVDLASDPPKIVDGFSTQRKYTACVATHGGARLYAVSGKAVYRIDIATRAQTKVFSGDDPSAVAVSNDNAYLSIADRGSKKVTLLETGSDSEKWSKSLDAPADALAATGDATASATWAFATSTAIRRFDQAGLAQDLAANLTPGDSVFSSNGARAYVAHKGATGWELVMIARNGGSEVARVALPDAIAGIAVLPNRWRALATHPDTGKVSVVDAVDLRTRLCRALSGPCPGPADAPCIVLATFELLPDGTIGKLDACTYRTRLLSNEMLLELILCLAARQDVCCGGSHPQPQPEKPPEHEDPPPPPPDHEDPPPPPPQVILTQVDRVEFVHGANNDVVLPVTNPATTVTVSLRRPADGIRLHFTRKIDHATITAGAFNDNPAKFSLLVQGDASHFPDNYIPGTIEASGPQECIFRIHREFAQDFPRGGYRLTLFCEKDPSGTRPAVADTAGRRVDGETKPSFPSGDGNEGGDFQMKFKVG